jgi:MSHA biogenesis protein MshL
MKHLTLDPRPAAGAHRRPAAHAAGHGLAAVAVALALSGCASTPAPKPEALAPEIRQALTAPAAAPAPAPLPPEVAQALVPPPQMQLPQLAQRAPEPRFDVNVVALPAAQVLAALAKDTRYSMLVDPSLAQPVTVNLKDVTLLEALDTLRELYGFEYRVQGTRIFVQPAALQTRMFQVNFPTGQRTGRTEMRVTSGSIALAHAGAGGAQAPGAPASAGPTAQESTQITTQVRNDLWQELEDSLKLLLSIDDKDAGGRQVIVSPQTSVILVRALPRELRTVEQFLAASRLNIERQVMLEAKIVDVRLRTGQQTGINWAAFRTGDNHRGSIGPINPGTTLRNTGDLLSPSLNAAPGSTLTQPLDAAAGLFGLAFQTGSFAALLSFLETQGEVQVLSSPRIATLNNQKAVLKVGTDDFFVTGITTTTTTGVGGGIVSTPTITVQPFFSGIALDVTPQIDAEANIILHVHPSVSSVAERTKQLNLGSLGNFTLPLASSSISETDTIVRVRDAHIVAIGGLMKTSRMRNREQLPGAGDLPVLGHLFGSRESASDKHELVILIKPTVIHSDAQAAELREQTLQRLERLAGGR